MEKMVTDPQINKVAIICDEKYAKKADERAGGVGTETQIISREIYENQDQGKFVVIVRTKDENGKPHLPTYYKSRIYIDLSDAERYGENYERLLRWILNKPIYVKPAIGKIPSYLSEAENISLGTGAAFKRCAEAIKNNKPNAAGCFTDYCTILAENFERFRISKKEGEFDDAVIQNIEQFIPHRNEAIQLFATVAQYNPGEEFTHQLHRFFESLIPYMDHPKTVYQWQEWDFDNFKFLIHELFLYALAVLLKYDRIEQATYLLQQSYYWPQNASYGNEVMVSYRIFHANMTSLEHRNSRLKLKRASIRSDLLHERSAGNGVEFRYILQADFIAFMRAEVESSDPRGWWPETLLYLGRSHAPLEIFARSVSLGYFNRVKSLLAIDSPKDLEPLLSTYNSNRRYLPSWGLTSFSPRFLLGYESLATKP